MKLINLVAKAHSGTERLERTLWNRLYNKDFFKTEGPSYPKHVSKDLNTVYSDTHPMIYALVVADSISPTGDRLTTVEVRMHRWVLAEFNTHRVFSRNSASSRAVPPHKRILSVTESPAMPVYWGLEQSGMQDAGKASDKVAVLANRAWRRASHNAAGSAEELMDLKIHKGLTNRLLEPFLYHTVVVSATEWQNFFAQRISELAQPEIHEAAKCIKTAICNSMPAYLDYGEWHTPYSDKDRPDDERKVQAVAGCARVSFENHGGTRVFSKDEDLYTKLSEADPAHASPFEHVATPVDSGTLGNFQGYQQLRHQMFTDPVVQ